jgi:hypothetical protein
MIVSTAIALSSEVSLFRFNSKELYP